MRHFVYALAFAASTVIAFPAVARGQGETIFNCRLMNGKTVSVTARGDRLTYRYGTPRRAELTLSGTARSGNLFHLSERYFNILHQLRFQRGRHSYIVYSLPGSTRADAHGSFGLTVLRDGHRISDTQCRRETEFQGAFELLEALPQDDARFNVMSGD